MQNHPKLVIQRGSWVWFPCSVLTSKFFVNTLTELYQEIQWLIRLSLRWCIITLTKAFIWRETQCFVSFYLCKITYRTVCSYVYRPIPRLVMCLCWHSGDRASWYILIIKPTRCTNFSNLIFGIGLYMFRTGFLSIIRSLVLNRCMSYRLCWQLASKLSA
jgi:hypothetical protein